MKNKNHMIISKDAEKAFDKTQHPIMIITIQNVGMEGAYLNIMKIIYVANIILNSEKLKEFPLRSGTRQGCPPLTHFFILFCFVVHKTSTVFFITVEVLAMEIREEKEIRRIQVGGEKGVKLSLFAYGMILYIENPKTATIYY